MILMRQSGKGFPDAAVFNLKEPARLSIIGRGSPRHDGGVEILRNFLNRFGPCRKAWQLGDL
jgi:hypothetical protein